MLGVGVWCLGLAPLPCPDGKPSSSCPSHRGGWSQTSAGGSVMGWRPSTSPGGSLWPKGWSWGRRRGGWGTRGALAQVMLQLAAISQVWRSPCSSSDPTRGSCPAQAIHLTPPWADPAAQLRFVLPRVQPNLSSSSVSLQSPPKAAGSWTHGERTGKEASHHLHPMRPRKAVLHHHLTPVLLALRPSWGLQQSPEQRVAPGESSTT